MNYRIRPRAEADLREIWRYTSRNWSPEQADTYYNKLVDGIEAVAADGELGRPSFRSNVFRHVVGSHVIYFRRRGSMVYIIRVLHSRMDPDRHIS